MSITISQAIRLVAEGREARKANVTKDAYPRGSSEFRWWSAGWLDEDKEIRNNEAIAEDWDRELYGDDYEHLRDSGWLDSRD